MCEFYEDDDWDMDMLDFSNDCENFTVDKELNMFLYLPQEVMKF